MMNLLVVLILDWHNKPHLNDEPPGGTDTRLAQQTPQDIKTCTICVLSIQNLIKN